MSAERSVARMVAGRTGARRAIRRASQVTQRFFGLGSGRASRCLVAVQGPTAAYRHSDRCAWELIRPLFVNSFTVAMCNRPLHRRFEVQYRPLLSLNLLPPMSARAEEAGYQRASTCRGNHSLSVVQSGTKRRISAATEHGPRPSVVIATRQLN